MILKIAKGFIIFSLILISCEKNDENSNNERFPLLFEIVNNSNSVIGAHIDARIYYPEEDVTWFLWQNCSELRPGLSCKTIADEDYAYIGCEYQFFTNITKYMPHLGAYVRWNFYNGLDTIKNSRDSIFIFQWPRDINNFELIGCDTIIWNKKSMELFENKNNVVFGRKLHEK